MSGKIKYCAFVDPASHAVGAANFIQERYWKKTLAEYLPTQRANNSSPRMSVEDYRPKCSVKLPKDENFIVVPVNGIRSLASEPPGVHHLTKEDIWDETRHYWQISPEKVTQINDKIFGDHPPVLIALGRALPGEWSTIVINLHQVTGVKVDPEDDTRKVFSVVQSGEERSWVTELRQELWGKSLRDSDGNRIQRQLGVLYFGFE